MGVDFSGKASNFAQAAYNMKKSMKGAVLGVIASLPGIVKTFEKSEQRVQDGYIAALHDFASRYHFTRFSVDHGSGARRTFIMKNTEAEVLVALEAAFPAAVVAGVMES